MNAVVFAQRMRCCSAVTRKRHQRVLGIRVRTASNSSNSSSSNVISESAKTNSSSRRSSSFATAVAVITVTIVGGSVAVRQWRTVRIEHELPAITDETALLQHQGRSLASILSVIRRAGLMGKHVSVKAELDDIRQWHTDNGYKGGLVVRDLSEPLFFGLLEDGDEKDDDNSDSNDSSDDWGNVVGEILQDPMRLARRECYYLYYEITPTGKHSQQIFCRGTTLWIDILTCLQTWMVHDDDMECRVHKGFLNQAERVLQDVLPLLAPPTDRRAEIELCGHSLGGAVAAILAVKLRKRGYRVTRLTTVGEPAYVESAQHATHLQQLLPADHLRVENDRDFVPFLPPFGSHVGNKLWLTSGGTTSSSSSGACCFFVEAGKHAWTDSVWFNFYIPEILFANGKPHRIPCYLERLAAIDPPTTNCDGAE